MTNLSPNLCCHSPTIALSNLVSNMVLLEQKSGAGSVNHYLVSSIFCSINQQTSVEKDIYGSKLENYIALFRTYVKVLVWLCFFFKPMGKISIFHR